MDPYTQTLALINNILSLSIKIYDDTPQELRVKSAERWGRLLDNIDHFFTTGKLPGQP